MKKNFLLLPVLATIWFSVGAQTVSDPTEFDAIYMNWYNKDLSKDGIFGCSVEKAYNELLANKSTKKTVVVAVIDGGVDLSHPDFANKQWINTNEIAGNGIDDDQNGYIDDVNGWNFIGNAAGANVVHEHFEFARIVKKGDTNAPDYAKAKEFYDKEMKDQLELKENLVRFENILNSAKFILLNETGVKVKGPKDLEGLAPKTDQGKAAKGFLVERYEMGFVDSDLDLIKKQNSDFLDYMLNLEQDYRSIIGDNPEDINDKNYGNSNVKGPRANHGTSVAGVIAANRGNGIGIDGIATDVKIMAIRSTPDGDERDKDVALAIRYAVDNGADIINMSFGKDFSPQKSFVDEAIKYADEKGVLMIHASGNDGVNLEVTTNFPTDTYTGGGKATNWIEVGASHHLLDEEIAAPFSNYGLTAVDLFAPGTNIISLDTANSYSLNDGTSLASPVVAGVAALVLSYYPELTATQLKEVLMNSVEVIKKPKKVLQPSEEEKPAKVKFNSLSVTGGIVNAYKALKEAEKVVSSN